MIYILFYLYFLSAEKIWCDMTISGVSIILVSFLPDAAVG